MCASSNANIAGYECGVRRDEIADRAILQINPDKRASWIGCDANHIQAVYRESIHMTREDSVRGQLTVHVVLGIMLFILGIF